MVMFDQEIASPEHLGRLAAVYSDRWGSRIAVSVEGKSPVCRIECRPAELQEICEWLMRDLDFSFATLVVEEQPAWSLTYVFYKDPSRLGFASSSGSIPARERCRLSAA